MRLLLAQHKSSQITQKEEGKSDSYDKLLAMGNKAPCKRHSKSNLEGLDDFLDVAQVHRVQEDRSGLFAILSSIRFSPSTLSSPPLVGVTNCVDHRDRTVQCANRGAAGCQVYCPPEVHIVYWNSYAVAMYGELTEPLPPSFTLVPLIGLGVGSFVSSERRDDAHV